MTEHDTRMRGRGRTTARTTDVDRTRASRWMLLQTPSNTSRAAANPMRTLA
jgi:hypothetical protein